MSLLYGQVFGSISTEGKVKELADSCSVVLHIILTVQGGVLVHCAFCASPIADNLWWEDGCKSIAPQMAADAGVPHVERH